MKIYYPGAYNYTRKVNGVIGLIITCYGLRCYHNAGVIIPIESYGGCRYYDITCVGYAVHGYYKRVATVGKICPVKVHVGIYRVIGCAAANCRFLYV